MIDLGTLGGSVGAAFDIGDDGVVVGYARAANGVDQGFIWDSVVGMRRAPGLPSTQRTYCYARNASDRIVGSLFNSLGVERAFFMEPGMGLQDPVPGYSGMCTARSVNALGALVGQLSGGYLARPTGPIETFMLIPTGLNDQELVVGATAAQQAAYWTAATGVRVLPAGALTPTKAWGVSGTNQIIGYGTVVGGAHTHGFLFTEGSGVTDLNNLVIAPGIEITEARDINSAGQIAGTCFVQATGQTHAVLLTPPAAGAVIFVDRLAPAGGNGQSWATAFRSPQDAFDMAALFPGVVQEVWVAQGTYLPTRRAVTNDPRSAAFSVPLGVSVYGGFSGVETERGQRDWNAHPTVLSGDLGANDTPGFGNRSDNAYHVVMMTLPEFGEATLDGFTVRGGNASQLGPADRSGAGVHSIFGSPRIANCLITDCSADQNGGGIYLVGTRAKVTACTIHGNRSYGSGAGGYFGFRARVEGCTFSGNTILPGGGEGAGAYSTDFVVFLNCSVFANTNQASGVGGTGGGLSVARAYNCRIFGNTALTCGGIAAGAASNCLVYGNTAGTVAGGRANFVNSVIAYNHATSAIGPGGVGFTVAANSMSNSLVWGNSYGGPPGEQAQIQYDPSNPPAVSFSSVQAWTGLLGGAGNNGLDPVFRDVDGADNIPGTADDDFRLVRPYSPSIDSGDGDALPPDTDDIDADGDLLEPLPLDYAGNPRQVEDPLAPNLGHGAPPIDRGAFEMTPDTCYANCDDGTMPPVLNVLDFNCFLARFAAGDSYANCDGGTVPPVLNVLDFNCFLSRFAGGCQ
jgi:uncharacterized membrane protein